MWNFLKPAPHKDLLPEGKIDSTYKSLRWQVFVGIFIGYAGYYIDGDAVSNRPRRTLRVRQGIAEYRVVVERGGLRPVEVLDGERLGS